MSRRWAGCPRRRVLHLGSGLCLLAGASVGCRPIAPKPDSGAMVFESADPTLTGLALACDPTEGRWSVALRTDAWVGTARLWMGTRADDLEQHELEVDRSAADGSWDCLEETVRMAADVASPGSGTRFRCSDRADLHVLVAVSESSASRWTDCTSWGPDTPVPWESVGGVPSCDERGEVPFAADTYVVVTGDVADCP